MNVKKSVLFALVGISAIGAIVFFLRTQNLKNQLLELQENQSSLSKELQEYEGLVHIDSMLLKGEYETALSSYNESLRIHNENKMGIPVRIALTEKLIQVERFGAENHKNSNAVDTLPAQMKAIAKEVRKFDSLNFTLEKTKVQLARLRSQLKQKSFGEYLKFKSRKGNNMHYVGGVKHGKANGYGIALLDTGSRYEGQWKNNQRHGEGTYYWADGEYYVGHYDGDKRSGFGIYYWPNGEKYEGQWQDDKRSGSGKFFGADGDVVTGGQWQDDKLVEVEKKGSR